jgi:hypothetical protein
MVIVVGVGELAIPGITSQELETSAVPAATASEHCHQTKVLTGCSKPVTGANVAVSTSLRCAIPEVVGLTVPNCGLLSTAPELTVKAEAEPAPDLLLRTVAVTRAIRCLPAIASVGAIELELAFRTCVQSAGMLVGATGFWSRQVNHA